MTPLPLLGTRPRLNGDTWTLSGAPRLAATTPDTSPDPYIAVAPHTPFTPGAKPASLTELDLPQQPAQDFDFSNLDVLQPAAHTVQTTVANDPHTNHTRVARLRKELPHRRDHAARHEI
ncbi:hypothetical protein ACIG3E_16395 [Streptomyces sp. NPDC053474]|uniref:hypothetical protein n=1 Tax=Streptomyces sp. NPDC053474 TaxID=3365704 RepID=UPI0037CCECF0